MTKVEACGVRQASQGHGQGPVCSSICCGLSILKLKTGLLIGIYIFLTFPVMIFSSEMVCEKFIAQNFLKMLLGMLYVCER